MRNYGANKATEFSKKQIGVVYAKSKAGELKVEKWVMSDLYDLADYYGYDDSKSVERAEAKVLAILEAVFAGDTEKAQSLIDDFTANRFETMSRKAQEKAERTFA